MKICGNKIIYEWRLTGSRNKTSITKTEGCTDGQLNGSASSKELIKLIRQKTTLRCMTTIERAKWFRGYEEMDNKQAMQWKWYGNIYDVKDKPLLDARLLRGKITSFQWEFGISH